MNKNIWDNIMKQMLTTLTDLFGFQSTNDNDSSSWKSSEYTQLFLGVIAEILNELKASLTIFQIAMFVPMALFMYLCDSVLTIKPLHIICSVILTLTAPINGEISTGYEPVPSTWFHWKAVPATPTPIIPDTCPISSFLSKADPYMNPIPYPYITDPVDAKCVAPELYERHLIDSGVTLITNPKSVTIKDNEYHIKVSQQDAFDLQLSFDKEQWSFDSTIPSTFDFKIEARTQTPEFSDGDFMMVISVNNQQYFSFMTTLTRNDRHAMIYESMQLNHIPNKCPLPVTYWINDIHTIPKRAARISNNGEWRAVPGWRFKAIWPLRYIIYNDPIQQESHIAMVYNDPQFLAFNISLNAAFIGDAPVDIYILGSENAEFVVTSLTFPTLPYHELDFLSKFQSMSFGFRCLVLFCFWVIVAVVIPLVLMMAADWFWQNNCKSNCGSNKRMIFVTVAIYFIAVVLLISNSDFDYFAIWFLLTFGVWSLLIYYP